MREGNGVMPLVLAENASQAVRIIHVDTQLNPHACRILTEPSQLRGRRGQTVHAIGGWRCRRDVEEWFLAFERSGVRVVEGLPR